MLSVLGTGILIGLCGVIWTLQMTKREEPMGCFRFFGAFALLILAAAIIPQLVWFG